MAFYKFIRTKGPDGKNIGYYAPRMYHLPDGIALKIFTFQYVKDRLAGWTYWWVDNKDEYIRTMEKLDELRKTHAFIYQVSKYSNYTEGS